MAELTAAGNRQAENNDSLRGKVKDVLKAKSCCANSNNRKARIRNDAHPGRGLMQYGSQCAAHNHAERDNSGDQRVFQFGTHDFLLCFFPY